MTYIKRYLKINEFKRTLVVSHSDLKCLVTTLILTRQNFILVFIYNTMERYIYTNYNTN